jgi:hypothetical protein
MPNYSVSGRGACRLGLLMVALSALLLAGPGRASAATLTVCPGGCAYTTIAGALAAASSGDKIAVGAGSYGGGFTIRKNVSLLGAGASRTTISGGGPVVTVAGGVSATIAGVTVNGGSTGFFGGGLFNGGTLTLKDSTVSANAADGGGGIFNGGTLVLNDTTVSGNSARAGGGILNGGSVTLMDSTVSGNTALHAAGGILNGGSLTLKNSTVISNSAGTAGGGIFNGGTAALTDSTVSGNTPDDCIGC